MRAASVISTHPVVAIALGEAAGQVLEALDGVPPTLVLVAVTPPHLGTLEDVGAALRALLEPDVVLGAVASAVVGDGRHVAGGPAVALFAVADVAAGALSLETEQARGPSDPRALEHPRLLRRGGLDGATAAVVLADPFSCPAPALLGAFEDLAAGGGLVSGAQGPGGSRLLLDGAVRTSGAVGAFLGPPACARASQGATPVGEPWVVTRADGDMVLELGGRPAVERQRQALGDDEQPAALGLVLDDHAEDPGRADLLAIRVVGSGPSDGLRLAEPLAVGQVVRFLRTGPVDVGADLVSALAPSEPDATPSCQPSSRSVDRAIGPTGALIFPAEGRGGDADLVSSILGCPVAGVGVSAPLAPVGRRPGLHGPGATSLVLFP